MVRILTAHAQGLIPKGQPSQNTCWLTAYEMLFNSGGEYYVTQYDIERRLTNGGFDVQFAKSKALFDGDFPQVSKILNAGSLLPGQVGSMSGLSQNFNNFVVLWLALQIPKTPKSPDGERYKHILVVVGIDEERNQVGIINPWKQNLMDDAIVTWVNWEWFRGERNRSKAVANITNAAVLPELMRKGRKKYREKADKNYYRCID